MQLFTTYGVQSSVPPKTVVAVINEGSESAEGSYNFTVIDNNVRNTSIGQEAFLESGRTWAFTTDIIPIQGNTVIYPSEWNTTYFYVIFTNDSDISVALKPWADTNLPLKVPAGATKIALIFDKTQFAISTFQTYPLRYTTTEDYDLTFRTTQFWINNGTEGSDSRYASTTKLPIIGNSVILNSPSWFTIHFWNDSTYLGHYSNTNFSLSADGYWNTNLLGQYNNIVPNNATHFAINNNISVSDRPNQVPYNTFQTLTVLSEALSGKTVTFFDEYPNGTQIGDVVDVVAPTAEYSFTFTEGSFYDYTTGNISSFANGMRTDKIPIINNSIVLDRNYWIYSFWNNDTYLGLYVLYSDWLGGGLPLAITNGVLDLPIPQGATHFAINGHTGTSVHWEASSFATFQQMAVSYENPATVDPPATYKIRQLVFEE